jgi:hypothetical protein
MRKIMIMSLILLFLVAVGSVAAEELISNRFPFPVPNDEFHSFEPSITSDGNTIYFARWAAFGDPTVIGLSSIYETHRTNKSGGWPGTADDWSVPARLPAHLFGSTMDQEPWITDAGKTLYWMSNRPVVPGDPNTGRGIYVAYKNPDNTWTDAEKLPPHINNNTGEHCFMPSAIPGEGNEVYFMSSRPWPSEQGEKTTIGSDVWKTRKIGREWQQPVRIESALWDSIDYKCRVNSVLRDEMALVVLTIGKHGPHGDHYQLYHQYDLEQKEFVGPVIEAPYNTRHQDGGACPMFTNDGNILIWSSSEDYLDYDPTGVKTRPADLSWVYTDDIIKYYLEQTE